MQLSPLLKKIITHVLAWALFIFYEVSIVIVLTPSKTLWWEYLGYYSVNIALFYANAHLVFSYIFKREQKRYLIALLVPLELLLYTLVEYSLENAFNHFRSVPHAISFNQHFVLSCLWRGVYFIGLSTAYWFVLSTIDRNRRISKMQVQQADMERRKAELERGKVELERNLARSQNAYLRAQINPHLLFNTLSFVYSSVYNVSHKASQGIMLLSDIMHYALGPVHEDGKIDLSREIEQVKNYVVLNQLRFSKPLCLNMTIEGNFLNYRFPPLLLLTFVENLFKHGILNDAAHPATVTIRCKDNILCAHINNKKRKSYIKTGFGIGIQNVETRLKEFYQEEDFHLQIQETDQHYTTNLKVHLA